MEYTMHQRLFYLFILFILFALVGCNTTEPIEVAQATVAPTNTTEPTVTAVPPTKVPTKAATDTPEPTATEEPTKTPLPTKTPTDTPEPTETAVPTNTPKPIATNTAVPVATNPPPPPASLPAIGSPPSGPNLVINPGFEDGTVGWNVDRGHFNTTPEFPNFVHSGSASLMGFQKQHIGNLESGKSYRLGVWVKVWTSDGENREISENPGSLSAQICININGDGTIADKHTHCSGLYQPLDTWQYITYDATPLNNSVVIFLSSARWDDAKRVHNLIYWDDLQFGLSPASVGVATPTPAPLGPPSPPSPIVFDAVAMRDNMNNTRSNIEQMGGVLDRLYNGSRETCEEYMGYYRAIVASPRYDGVPTEWQGVYNEYIFAVENASNSNEPIFNLCFDRGGGEITAFNYGLAREGINNSLNHLAPAIDLANSMLGG